MHLTGGQYKGRKIKVPDYGVKPTLSKVRESVFNISMSKFEDFSNLTFLDLFAGSGIMSLEAISRGFDATLIEKNKNACEIIKENFKTVGLKPNLIFGDCMKIITKPLGYFDVIYIDPPWSDPAFKYDYNDILKLAFQNLEENGLIFFESEKKALKDIDMLNKIKKLPSHSSRILSKEFEKKLIKEKDYGRCRLSIFEY